MSDFYIVLDFETTGIDPKKDKIIEIGAIKVNKNFEIIDSINTLINPEIPIPDFITQLTHGIDSELVSTFPTMELVKKEFNNFLGSYPVIAHNIDFEKSFIKNNFNKNIKNEFLETMELFSIFFPDIASLKLNNLIGKLNIRAGGERHRAYDDAYDLLAVLLWIKNKVSNDKKFYATAKRAISSFNNSEWGWIDVLKIFISFEIQDKQIIKKLEPDTNGEQDLLVEDKCLKFEELSKLFVSPLEDREQQKKYLSLVCDSINENKNIFIEAGTGTGKTIAYLIPAIKWTIDNQKSFIISTKTKTLQQQIFDNDLPLAKKLLNIDKYDALKVQGRNNYLCIRKLDKFFSNIDLFDDFETKFTKLFFYAFDLLSTNGDLMLIPTWLKNKYPFIESNIEILASDISTCIQSRCSFYNECHYFNMIRLARKSKLMIANHSLILNWPTHLPKGEMVVFDEAHNLEKEATSATTVEISNSNILKYLSLIYDAGKHRGLLLSLKDHISVSDYESIIETTEKAGDILVLLKGSLINFIETYNANLTSRINTDYNQEILLFSKNYIYGKNDVLKIRNWGMCTSLIAELYSCLVFLNNTFEKLEGIHTKIEDEEKILFLSLFEKLEIYIAMLDDLLKLGTKNLDNFIFIFEYNLKKEFWNFKKILLNVGVFLKDSVYSKYKTNIFTSATLTAGENSIAKSIGLDQEIFKLDSSFDYKNNSSLCFIENSSAPTNPNFIENLGSFIIKTVTIINGRTLVLFSSWKRLEQVYQFITPFLKKQGIMVFKQSNSMDVVETFKDEHKSVLLGTESYGEGLDIKGDKLSCVIMERMPIVFKDSVYTAREFFFTNSYNRLDYEIPKRVLKLKQWSGRLIRSSEDKGVVVVYDDWYSKLNLNFKNYIKKAIEPMPLVYIKHNFFHDWFHSKFKSWS